MPLEFTEKMAGTHTMLVGPEAGQSFPLSVELSFNTGPGGTFWNPLGDGFWKLQATGIVQAGHLAESVPCVGSLTLRYVRERKIHYDLAFTGDDGHPYRLYGVKRDILPWNLWRTHFEAFARIEDRDSGDQVAEAHLRFSYRDIPSFMRSFHLVPG